jgi:hypothetical protein
MPRADASCVEPSTRRRYRRVSGPFDGRRVELLTVPLRIYDLSVGGCLIQCHHDQAPGRRFTMEIELPGEGWVEVQAESLYMREGYGFAARFVEMSDDARQRLERAIARLGG